MTDPRPDKGRGGTGDDPGSHALAAASIEPQVYPRSPQPDGVSGGRAPLTLKSENTSGIDGDATLSRNSANDLRVSPTLSRCATTPVTTEAAQPNEEHGSRVDRLSVDHPSTTASTRLPLDGSDTPLNDEESNLHAALVDEMKSHPGEGPLDILASLYTSAEHQRIGQIRGQQGQTSHRTAALPPVDQSGARRPAYII